jgi:hypothetical protein
MTVYVRGKGYDDVEGRAVDTIEQYRQKPANQTGVQTAADNAVIYTSGDVSNFNIHYIEAIGGAVSVDVSIDGGTNYVQDVTLRNVKSTTPNTFIATVASGGLGELRGNFSNLKVLQSGAGAAVNARIRHANL